MHVGHVNFLDEMSAACRLCDGVAVVVDASEGVMMVTEQVIKHALQEKLALTVCINKVRRKLAQAVCRPAAAFECACSYCTCTPHITSLSQLQ